MYRSLFLLGFLVCAGSLAYAYYAEYVLYLDPCPLCMLQRIAMIATGLIMLIAAIAGRGLRIWGGLSLLAASVGAVLAGRHVYIQNLPPDQVPACGAGLDFLLETQGFFAAIAQAFQGTGDCATVDWTFLGLSMPAWVLILFVGLGLLALLLTLKAGQTVSAVRPPPPPVA